MIPRNSFSFQNDALRSREAKELLTEAFKRSVKNGLKIPVEVPAMIEGISNKSKSGLELLVRQKKCVVKQNKPKYRQLNL